MIEHFQVQSGKLYESSIVEALFDGLPQIRSAEHSLRDSVHSEFAASGSRLKASRHPAVTAADRK